jgi:hypothetical protein
MKSGATWPALRLKRSYQALCLTASKFERLHPAHPLEGLALSAVALIILRTAIGCVFVFTTELCFEKFQDSSHPQSFSWFRVSRRDMNDCGEKLSLCPRKVYTTSP